MDILQIATEKNVKELAEWKISKVQYLLQELQRAEEEVKAQIKAVEALTVINYSVGNGLTRGTACTG